MKLACSTTSGEYMSGCFTLQLNCQDYQLRNGILEMRPEVNGRYRVRDLDLLLEQDSTAAVPVRALMCLS
jgi:hypothetical protein